MDDLKKKLDLYLSLLPSAQEQYGFIEHSHCDALLFSGLVGCVPGVKMNIEAAYEPDRDMWLRRPAYLGPCYSEKGGSSISRDMLVGLAWFTFYNKKLGIAENIIRKAEGNWMRMGEGELNPTIIMPPLLATYCLISRKLGGMRRWWLDWVPADVDPANKGYMAHIQTLHIVLRRQITGKWFFRDKEKIRAHYNRNPDNAFYAFLVGDKERAYKSLMNTNWFPKDRLPSHLNKREPWLWQREMGSDYFPHNQISRHAGGDFIFVAAMMTGLLPISV